MLFHRYTSGVDMVTYKNDGNTPGTLTLSGAVDTSTTVDWTGASTVSNNKYAINVNLDARKYLNTSTGSYLRSITQCCIIIKNIRTIVNRTVNMCTIV